MCVQLESICSERERERERMCLSTMIKIERGVCVCRERKKDRECREILFVNR